MRIKRRVHVQDSGWCLAHSKCSIIAPCNIRCKRIIKEEMINSTKERVAEKVMSR